MLNKKNSKICFTIIFLALISIVISCSKPAIIRHFNLYYKLGNQDNNITPPHDISLAIRKFNCNSIYDEPRLVYRTNPFEYGYYHYKRWGIIPSEMLSDLVFRHISNANLARRVGKEFSLRSPNLILSGTIEIIEELDVGKEWYAHLAISLKLINNKNNVTIWTGGFDSTKKSDLTDPLGVVKAMSILFKEQMDKITLELKSEIDLYIQDEGNKNFIGDQ